MIIFTNRILLILLISLLWLVGCNRESIVNDITATSPIDTTSPIDSNDTIGICDDNYKRIIELQTQIPIPYTNIVDENREQYLDEYFGDAKNEIISFLTGGDDPVMQNICEYIYKALPGDPLIDYMSLTITQEDDISNQLLLLAGLHSLNSTHIQEYKNQIQEILGKDADISGHIDIWFGEHVEHAARELYGSSIPINHMSLGNKRYHYDPEYHFYTHFPGGMYMITYILPVVDYIDNGDNYIVEIAIIEWSDGGFVIPNDKSYEYFGYDRISDMAMNHAPRARVTLKKTDSTNYGVMLQSYEYIGATDNN